jgi:hypothetical protein
LHQRLYKTTSQKPSSHLDDELLLDELDDELLLDDDDELDDDELRHTSKNGMSRARLREHIQAYTSTHIVCM